MAKKLCNDNKSAVFKVLENGVGADKKMFY